MVKTVICDTDLKRNSLCEECKNKLNDGKISELDITASRLLSKISNTVYLENVEFKKALDLGDLVVLVCTGNIGLIIGKKGKNVAELSKELGKKVRIIEETKDEKKMIQDLIGEARIIAVNKIFKRDGHEHKIMIKEADKAMLVTDIEKLNQAIEALLSTSATIEFV